MTVLFYMWDSSKVVFLNKCRYDCIENDLLGSVVPSVELGTLHKIAPYKSEGIEKASELSISDKDLPFHCGTNGKLIP